jgi:hypothetical protein
MLQTGTDSYACPRDQNFLVTIPDAEGVLRCAACGHRTDEPGSGMLVDAFDVAHRQFGLRGDVHAWNAIRELVATTPTRPIADAARVVFVDALRQVADVDLDHTDEQHRNLPRTTSANAGAKFVTVVKPK